MTRLTLITVLLLTFALPPAIRKPSCYVTGRWPTYACMCGRVAVPMWVCKAKIPR